MTREETKKCIEVMQAYIDGKEIEFQRKKGNPVWELFPENFQDPSWYWIDYNYRIKEEPLPFDWRGKNIQWVREISSPEIVHKVLQITPTGLVFWRQGNGLIKFNENNYEWSEDNATWRKFE